MNETFGERLSRFRKLKKYTQEQLSELIDIAKSTLAGYERGYREPNLLNISKISQALEVTIDELLGVAPNEFLNKAISRDEQVLLEAYRALNEQGKEYIQHTLSIALNTYKKPHSSNEKYMDTELPKILDESSCDFAPEVASMRKLAIRNAIIDQQEEVDRIYNKGGVSGK